MTRSIGAAIVLLALMIAGSATPNRAMAASPQVGASTSEIRKATGVSARRRTWHTHSADRPQDQLYYIDRPRYYTPAPFVPFNYGYVFWPRIFWWP